MSRSQPPPPPTQNNARNEYIPAYISNKPFYAEDLLKDQEYLAHQRSKAEQKDTIDKAKWYERGRKSGPAATKFRKGACENCGAMTHKTKDCLERPRKHGAKYTGKNIQADEIVDDISLGWDAKRDRWNGYDVREYDTVVKDYEEIEALRKKAALETKKIDPDDDQAEGDGDHYAEETDMGRSQPTSTRQLRLREDTAKYLLDLNLDSAKYDPKTRSMDTTAQSLNNADPTNTDLASEGFTRPSHDPKSDAAAFEKAQRYAWETQEKPSHPTETVASNLQQNQSNGNGKVHLEANPTASALAHKKYQAEVTSKKEQQQSYLLSKYGESEAKEAPKRPLAVASSAYTTYDPATGREIDQSTGKVMLRDIPRSRYAEDVYPGNHSSVFGSWWRDRKWGFRCCHSFVKNSYCTGEEGIKAFDEEEAQRSGRNLVTEQREEMNDAEMDELTSRKRKAGDELEIEDRGKRGKTEEII